MRYNACERVTVEDGLHFIVLVAISRTITAVAPATCGKPSCLCVRFHCTFSSGPLPGDYLVQHICHLLSEM
jgi:hypothetical protein